MKKAILYLSMLATMTASTGAMAEKYYYKQRLDGVKAEVNQEDLDNRAMCLNESIQITNDWTNLRYIYHNESMYVKDVVYGINFSDNSWRIYAGEDGSKSVNDPSEYHQVTMTSDILKGEAKRFFEVGTRYRLKIATEQGLVERLNGSNRYKIQSEEMGEVEKKTENYDWCIENGYEVAE